MRWKTQGVIGLFLLVTFGMIIVQIPSVKATNIDYQAPYFSGTAPTIDGDISAAEWLNASKNSLTFNFTGTGNPTIEVDLYLLHNGSALFIGINVTTADDPINETDAFYIYFDEEDNGDLCGNATIPREDGLKLLRNGSLTDLSYDGDEWIEDESIVNLTSGPSYGATNGVGEWEFVFISAYDPATRFPMNTSDFDVNLPSNVNEHPVEIGINIEYYDADIDQVDSFTTPTNETVNATPAVWDNLVCGVVPSSPPNMAVIWAYIIIAMIVPAALIVYIIFWLKGKEVE